MDVTAIQPSAGPQAATSSRDSLSVLKSEDFFRLLITQLTNQDPLEPTSNQDLLKQIASIRDIELSSSLTDSLGALSGQQNFSSASTLIGKFVTGTADQGGPLQSGVVVGVRFSEGNRAMLQLASGDQIPIDQVQTIQSAQQAAQTLVGQSVVGIDRASDNPLDVQEGVVTGVRMESGGVMLELDTGETIRFEDVIAVRPTQPSP